MTCAKCGGPIRMTSLGCFGHLEGQVITRLNDRTHAALPTRTGGRGYPESPLTHPRRTREARGA